MPEQDPRELVAEVERRLEQVEALPDAGAREAATGAVQALLELYGTGLERVVEIVSAVDDGRLAAEMSGDELVSHLLLVHGLHPVALEDRVAQALGEVRPYLESHGGDVELLEIERSAVRLRLQGSCSGCPSSAMTLKLAIENAIHKAAPEIEEVIAEEAAPTPGAPLLQIELANGLGAAASAPEPEGAWEMAGALPELSGGGILVKQVAGQPILFLKLQGQPYGYRPSCPACEESLAGAQLQGIELICPGCGNRYDVIRAGRCLDSPHIHLDPVPLLVGEDGLVRIALALAA